jgi:UDP-N-acetylmuramate dehydrogenase
VGGAEVSRRHANFLVLHPGGTATDLIRLIRAVKQKVQEHTGVALEQEVVIWGETPLEV